ncbi:MAG: tandem-95 repeat protein, partial [Terriglobia bacterium]
MATRHTRLAPPAARIPAAMGVCLLLLGFPPLTLLADDKPAAAPAGTVTALIPKDYIERGKTVAEAQKGAPVFWRDIIRTEKGGRVRIGLSDGSILNIGSQARLRIVSHDEQSQQSELALTYGKLRAIVANRTREGSSFRVRTRQAVAGVIGTEEYLDATPTATVVMALHGIVVVTSSNPNITGEAVLQPGQLTVVFSNRPPEPPRSATAEEVQSAFGSTASDPVVTIVPDRGAVGTTVEAEISGDNLAEATAVRFAQDGLTAVLRPGATAETLPVTITIDSNVPPGAYTFTVETPTGNRTGNFIVYTQEVPVVVFTTAVGFSLSLSPETNEGAPLELARGDQVEVTVTLVPDEGFSGTVSLGVGPLPEGLVVEPATATLSNLGTEGAPPESVTLAISATGNAPTGPTSIPITGASGTLTPVSALIYVSIGEVAAGGFALEVNPATTASTPVEVQLGARAEFEVTLVPDAEFAGVVALSVGELPQGITVEPTTVQFSHEPGQSAPPPTTFTVYTSRETPLGVHEIQLFAAAEGFETQTVPIFIEVTPPPPPVAVIGGELYYSQSDPPVSVQLPTVEAAHGARLRLEAGESTAADGLTLVSYQWEIVGTPLRAQGPVFDLDTWELTPGPSYRVVVTVQDDLGQTATAELTLTLRELPNPEHPVSKCLQAGTESLQLSQFMNCFDEQRFSDYPTLEEQTWNFFDQLTAARVYYVVANSQLIPGADTTAILQINPFQITFTTKTEPGFTQQRTDALTLRLLLIRDETREEWKITDFASQTGATVLLSDFSLLTTNVSGVALTTEAPLRALRGGPSDTIIVQVQSLGGFTGTVELSVEELPAGLTATFASRSVAADSATELTFNVDPSVAPGDFEITLVGAVGQLRRTRTLLLRVIEGFALTADTALTALRGGSSDTTIVQVQSLDGFTGTVELSVEELPAGLTATFASRSVAVGSATELTFNVDPSVAPGDFEITLVAQFGQVRRTSTLLLRITDFALTVAAPPSLVAGGEAGSTTVALQAINGFTGTVDLSLGPLPVGITATFAAPSLTIDLQTPQPQTILTVAAETNTPSGTFELTVVGSVGGVLRTQSLSVEVLNSAPVANEASVSLDEDTLSTITLSATDANGDPLTFAILTPPSHGTLGALTPVSATSATVDYTPDLNFNGDDSFSFTVSDGSAASSAAIIPITINPVNDAPFLTPISDQTIQENTERVISVTVQDVDGDPITLELVNAPSWASLGSVRLSPGFDVVTSSEGSASFQMGLQATDDKGASDQTNFTVTVTNVSRDPVADAQTVNTDEDTVASITLTGSDPDGDELTFAIATAPSNGTLGALTPVSATSATLNYTPELNFNGSDSFVFTVTDPSGLSSTATVTISVGAVNDAPVAVDDAY